MRARALTTSPSAARIAAMPRNREWTAVEVVEAVEVTEVDTEVEATELATTVVVLAT